MFRGMDRDFIIAEIRRTANENGGVPLGRGRFFKATGIKESDWLGRHWSKWGDALREAGFEPNLLQPRLADESVLESLATFVREIGHYPTTAELRIRARSEEGFPSHTTFARLGTKQQLVSKLQAYCASRSGFEEVAAICQLAATALKPQNRTADGTVKDEVFGCVYLMKSGRYYKIGRSNAAGRRERELAIQMPDKLATIHVIRTDDPAGIEGYWHRRFESKRKNGEWFDLSGDDVRAFRRRKFM